MQEHRHRNQLGIRSEPAMLYQLGTIEPRAYYMVEKPRLRLSRTMLSPRFVHGHLAKATAWSSHNICRTISRASRYGTCTRRRSARRPTPWRLPAWV
jgi:hypothetical protein